MAPLVLQEGRCAIIAEVAQAHDGSLGIAHSFIDMAADAGVDAVKFQTHIAHAESTPAEPWRVRFSYEDATRYEYWERTAFSRTQWQGLRDHCVERDVGFISSPFSAEAVDLLHDVGVSAWKVASGESLTLDLIDSIRDDGLPVLISTGMSTWKEIDAAVQGCRERGVEPIVLQSTSMYPTPPESVGLSVMKEMAARYDCPVGLSDHSGAIFPGLAAVALGAVAVEVHTTFSRSMFGPDAPASLEPDELSELVRGVRFLEIAMIRIGKDEIADDLRTMRDLFSKRLVSATALASGAVVTEPSLALRKAGGGIPAAERSRIIGRTLARSVQRGHVFEEGDFIT